MRYRSRLNLAALVTLEAAGGMLLSPPLRGDEPPDQRLGERSSPTVTGLLDPAQLRTLWEKQASEIAGGRFEVILFRYYDQSGKLLDRAEAIRRLEALDPMADEEVIEPLFDDIERLGWSKQESTLWGTRVEVAIDGQKVANVYHKPKGDDVHVYDGVDEISYLGNQASITSGRSNIALTDLAAIRTVPTWVSREQDVTVEPVNAREGILRSGRAVIRFDRATGFVKRYTEMNGGLAVREIVQIGPEGDGGASLPRIRAEIRCEGEKVRLLSIYLIEEADIDAVIEAKDFLVSVPAGTKVVDFRVMDQDRPRVVKVPIGLKDVKDYQAAVR
ncbi:hypothetical protein [Tautonia plasticadhaerens]|uniref:Uncharacterized protein n=1 Tax=Tautonia plasticadhaerens TaxID=2527974 RepID=A0A518H1X2_9BACT|nr:hypothetical protein [Tautonia plasticadhaerens]QDV34842.1 hypothetical protein ElP_27390 [Tautonia plasticadhaerens]